MIGAIGEISKAVVGGLDELFTSDEERARAETERLKTEQAPYLIQAKTNIAEAKHRSVFVAGWRPAIGWVCAAGLGYHFLINPLLAWALVAYGADISPPPDIDANALISLVMALLGIGGLRTFEKLRGLTA